ncbi:SET domain-containing protein [Vibrio sinaloensis]|uniref:SET domain-containing protein n=1 Tax=Photobacterium sp. (strain ATCC 43367) TaxID=379097 RepID=UPI000580289B|nr:SET domain-containing methyltransferase [Vibrio sinaloensis]KHT38504.1 hypothetical protein RJ47_19140 [Vibrio sinaloensis]
MPKLSSTIKKQAKLLRGQDKSLKLTEHQNNLAIKHGYKSFKALLKTEKESDVRDKITFALKSNNSSRFVYPSVGSGVAVFVRADGLRGLKATRDFKANETILIDDLLIGYNISQIGLAGKSGSWAMTLLLLAEESRGIIDRIIEQYNLRNSARPNFNQHDKEILDLLSTNLGHDRDYVSYVHSIVATYHSVLTAINPRNTVSTFAYMSAATIFMNHSCDANAKVKATLKANPFTKDLISISHPLILATKNIKKGDEITWSYDDECTKLDLKARQKRLKARFNFDCKCEKCFKDNYNIK